MSQDPILENNVSVDVSVPTEDALMAPLTRKERDLMDDLSVQAYGRKKQWRKMLSKGEFRKEDSVTGNGKSISVMRLHHFTLQEIHNTMVEILKKNEDARKAAEAKAAEPAEEAK